ncbi:hypothetical protein TTRE_0000411001 [Trichuris trichiura]|uniref:Uncharacterized protein n=1 Tax=Trichuris trichiura TaxID=36087 RepID=A0A077Z6M1_TRITR|nr:hypothetical protein TTRE_0000411001 [Trichuris trichiura]
MVDWWHTEFVHPLRCMNNRFCTLDFSKCEDDFDPAKQKIEASMAQDRSDAIPADNVDDSSTSAVKVVEVVIDGPKCCLKLIDQVDCESSRVDWPEEE